MELVNKNLLLLQQKTKRENSIEKNSDTNNIQGNESVKSTTKFDPRQVSTETEN